uniref:RRM domain-containing protein n=1 Tax=Kalanchoe fedtschenkoi TaxID=63787 RepID=A0A7N0U533_KALFE
MRSDQESVSQDLYMQARSLSSLLCSLWTHCSLPRPTLHNNSASSFVPVSPIVTRARNGPTFTLFVGGFGRGIDDQTLAEAFSLFGNLVKTKVIKDMDTRDSKGFGIVSFSDEDNANAAMGMDGQELAGRQLRVNSAESITGGGLVHT